MIRWVRAHPYTTALPFIAAGVTVVFKVLTSRPWLACGELTGAMFALAFFNVWMRRRRMR